jgi:hypothetical protein
MIKLVSASILALGLASPALAEQPAAWPRDHQISGTDHGRAVNAPAATAPSWTADSQSYANWRALPAALDAGGQFPTPQAELDAQRLRHRAYRMRRHSEIVEAGFCNAAHLPPEYAAFCWGALQNANQSGGPIGAGIN